ncbi:peptide chain release factor N(5)-glutamine methyltransferase [Vicingaceae bacterium]|nr:peptide chain release factor N(5)-glutamine methyltransferase [Vicingaceae bacterium]MDB4060765.1 peptide chain release factor N(5)-glutamine methyltransferase [Vicingaceae bacterium]MDB4082658.1 peptide chain release factor N(5)-glutamine methyltransferase [Vicingaceae bacterium]
MTLADFSKSFKKEFKDQFNENELNNHLAILYDFYLGYGRAQVVLNSSELIEVEELKKLNKAIAEIKTHKPIDYIINQSVFYGREFYVDESVLVPRSETEELVQWILEREDTGGKSILDIGTGSGCIPITLFLEGKFFKVDATEISESATKTAIKNARLLNANIEIEVHDILTQVPKELYDIVVSNPPYVKREELEALDKNVIEYEPVIALAPESDDPLLFYKRIVEIAPKMLKRKGVLYWEIHEDLGSECMALLEKGGFEQVELKEDIYGRNRMIRAVLT